MFIITAVTLSSFSDSPPRIINHKDELVVTTLNTLVLECEGTRSIAWKYPNNTIDGVMWSTVIVDISENAQADLYKFQARLTLENASYVDTGFYYCYEEDTNITSAHTYVYVEGKKIMRLSFKLCKKYLRCFRSKTFGVGFDDSIT